MMDERTINTLLAFIEERLFECRQGYDNALDQNTLEAVKEYLESLDT